MLLVCDENPHPTAEAHQEELPAAEVRYIYMYKE